MNDQATNLSQPEAPVTTNQQKPSKSKVVTYILLTLVIAAIAFAAGYLLQKSKIDSTAAALNTSSAKINELDRQLTEKVKQIDSPVIKEDSTTSTHTNTGLIPGDTDTRRNDGRVLIAAVFMYSLEPTAVWVEYGTDPGNLDKETSKQTRGLGMGSPDSVYATGFSVSISNTDLKPGTAYYYRTAATIKGQTERGAVASFVTDK